MLIEVFTLFLLPTLILVIGVIDDIWHRKFHNWLFLSLLAFSIPIVAVTGGVSGLITGFYGFLVAFALGFPLFLLGVIRAGDVKLLMVFAMTTSGHVVFNVMLLAILWGGVMGLMHSVISGGFFKIFNNLTLLLIYHLKPEKSSLHVIPYTVPICLAWSTHISMMEVAK